MADVKFSQFADGGTSQPNDVLVGLRAGVNTKFDGGYQPNNGIQQVDIGSGDVALSNPLPSVLYLINQIVDGRIITLPSLLDANSPQAGNCTIRVINAGYGIVTINNFSGNSIGTVPYAGVVEISVTTNASEFGWYISNPLQNYNNLGDLSNIDIARQILGLPQNYFEADCSISNVTLTNPLPNNIKVTGNNPVTKLILPVMNAPVAFNTPGSIPVGGYFWIQNFSGDVQALYAQDTTTLVANLNQGTVTKITLTDNSTANGSFLVDPFAIDYPLPTYLGGTGSANLSGAQSNLEITGLQSTPLWFLPTGSSGAVANQSSFGNGANYPYLQFVQSGLSYAYCIVNMPARWNGGTFTITIPWYTTVTSGTVVWTVDAAIVTPTNTLNPSFGTAVTVNSTAGASANVEISATTGAVTPSGTYNALSINMLVIRIYRNGGTGSDNMAASAFMLNQAFINWTASTGNDA